MIIISPSKNLDLNNENLNIDNSTPQFKSEFNKLTKKIKNLNVDQIKSLMKISDSLASLNHDRYKSTCSFQGLTRSFDEE